VVLPVSRLRMQAGDRRRSITKGETRMDAVVTLVHSLVFRDDDGQDLIEYGLLVGLIAMVAIAIVTTVGITVNKLFWETFTSAIASAV
jgi:Flp pilus assembly pilin Flp